MKYLIIFLVICFTYLCGCGNDSTTNSGGPGNGETVIFSMDSLSIYLNSSIQVNDTLFNLLDAPSIKVTFNCLTNADSINSLALFRIVAGDSIGVFKDTTNNIISSLNNEHIIYITATQNYALTILIQLSRLNSEAYFIKLNNIRVFKI